MFADTVEICLCKWFSLAATRSNVDDFSQKILLAACLNVGAKFVKHDSERFTAFVDNYFKLFIESETLTAISKEFR